MALLLLIAPHKAIPEGEVSKFSSFQQKVKFGSLLTRPTCRFRVAVGDEEIAFNSVSGLNTI